MTCLGERLTALVDGELDHDERDKALVHLASCAECRAEADTLRALKRRLGSLNDFPATTDLMNRLYGLGAESAPIQPDDQDTRPDLMSKLYGIGAETPQPDLVSRLYGIGTEVQAMPPVRAGAHQSRRPSDNRPPARRTTRSRGRIRSARYLVAGAATLAALGAGTASLVVSGEGPRMPSSPPSYAQMNIQLQNSDARLPRKNP
jgi:anti-sigma factor RsiW